MHLGLIDRPFVHHNLISTQKSPDPLLKFQMAPRLKILMASGSKKEPRYTFLFSQKSWQTNPLQVPQQGPYGEREVSLQDILHTSQKPHLSGSLAKEPSLKVPFMESLANRCPTTKTSFIHLSKPSAYEPPTFHALHMNVHSAVLTKFCPSNGGCWFYFEVLNFSMTVNGRTSDKQENLVTVIRYRYASVNNGDMSWDMHR